MTIKMLIYFKHSFQILIYNILYIKYHLLMIDKVKPHRQWRNVSYLHKPVDQSIQDFPDDRSVQSNNSIRFSKFKFKKQQDKPKTNSKPLHTFGSRISQLSSKHLIQKAKQGQFQKKHTDRSPKQQRNSRLFRGDSKISSKDFDLNGITGINNMTDDVFIPQTNVDKLDRKTKIREMQLRRITSEVKYMVGELKRSIEVFNVKYGELRVQWQKSFKKLLIKYVENTQLTKNIRYFQQKLEEMDAIKRPLDNYQVNQYQAGDSNKRLPSFRYSDVKTQSLNNLNISKIQLKKQASDFKKLQRNDTITSILNHHDLAGNGNGNGNGNGGTRSHGSGGKQKVGNQEIQTPGKLFAIGHFKRVSEVNFMQQKRAQASSPMKTQKSIGSIDLSTLNNAIKRMKFILQA